MASGGSQVADDRSEWRVYWSIVLVGFLGSALNATPSFMAGVFMAPVLATYGWSRTFYFSGPSACPGSSCTPARSPRCR